MLILKKLLSPLYNKQGFAAEWEPTSLELVNPFKIHTIMKDPHKQSKLVRFGAKKLTASKQASIKGGMFATIVIIG